MPLPPDREFKACMEVVRWAILEARVWGWQDNVSAEQLADLMDAVHNIPSLVQHWETCNQDWLKRSLEEYERKWAKSDGPCLRTLYERTLSDGRTAENDSHEMRLVTSDPEILQHAAHDAINLFVRDVLVPRGLINSEDYNADETIKDSQIQVARQVAEMWKESQVHDDA